MVPECVSRNQGMHLAGNKPSLHASQALKEKIKHQIVPGCRQLRQWELAAFFLLFFLWTQLPYDTCLIKLLCSFPSEKILPSLVGGMLCSEQPCLCLSYPEDTSWPEFSVVAQAQVLSCTSCPWVPSAGESQHTLGMPQPLLWYLVVLPRHLVSSQHWGLNATDYESKHVPPWEMPPTENMLLCSSENDMGKWTTIHLRAALQKVSQGVFICVTEWNHTCTSLSCPSPVVSYKLYQTNEGRARQLIGYWQGLHLAEIKWKGYNIFSSSTLINILCLERPFEKPGNAQV